MYTVPDFKTKKALKQAVAEGKSVSVYQPNDVFKKGTPRNESVTLEGPHYPEPHKWYATAQTDEKGRIIKGTVK